MTSKSSVRPPSGMVQADLDRPLIPTAFVANLFRSARVSWCACRMAMRRNACHLLAQAHSKRRVSWRIDRRGGWICREVSNRVGHRVPNKRPRGMCGRYHRQTDESS